MIQTSSGRIAVLNAFDALNRLATCDPIGHGKGRTMVCAICSASNGDPHSKSCQVGQMLSLINELDIPAYYDRDKWIADAPVKPKKFTFTVNGKEYQSSDPDISYETLLGLIQGSGLVTITYRKSIERDIQRAGILAPGQILKDIDGLTINISAT